MKKSKRLIIVDYRKEIVHTEIDIELLENMYPGYSDDNSMANYPQIHHKNSNKKDNNFWSGGQELLKIEDMEKAIQEFKKLGCTHMEVVHHSDHNGYYLYGANVHPASEKEKAEIYGKAEKNQEETLKRRKKELEKEMKEIESKLKK